MPIIIAVETPGEAAAPDPNWTFVSLGDDTLGSCTETSATEIVMNASGDGDMFLTNVEDGQFAYPTAGAISSGDCQVIAKLPTTYTGTPENYAGMGVMIRDDLTDDREVAAQLWFPEVGSAVEGKYRNTAQGSVVQSITGIADTSRPRWVAITYSAGSPGTLKFWESADGADYFQVGSDVSITFTGTYYAGVYGTAHDNLNVISGTIDNISVSGTITISEATPPVPDNRVGLITEWNWQSSTFNTFGAFTDSPNLRTWNDGSTTDFVLELAGGTWGANWDTTRKNILTEEGVAGPEGDNCIVMEIDYNARNYTQDLNAPRNQLYLYPGGWNGRLAMDTEYWQHTAWFIPADYESDSEFGRETLYQLHSDSTSPGMIEINIDRGRFRVRTRNHATNTVGATEQIDHIDQDITSDLGQWIYLTINWRMNPFSTQTTVTSAMGSKAQVGETFQGNQGIMRIWKSMAPGASLTSVDLGTVTNSTGSRVDMLVSDQTGIPVGRVPDWRGGIPGENSCGIELGIYKSVWWNRELYANRPSIPHPGSTKAGPIKIWLGPVRIGDASSNFSSVHPLQIAEPT